MSLRDRVAAAPLSAFALVTVGWSWGLWLLGGPDSLPAVLAGAWGPTVGAVVVTAATGGRPAVRRLLARLVRWRVPLWSYPFVLGVVPATVLAAVGLVVALGGTPPVPTLPADLPGRWEWALLPLVFLVNVLVGGPLAEELGWRGFVQPRLTARFGVLGAGAVVGVCWGLWHLPFFLLPGSGFVVGGLSPPAFVALTTGWGVLVGWATTVGRGSVLLAVLFHASVNTTLGTVVSAGGDAVLSAAVVGTTALAVAGLVVAVRTGRAPADADVTGY
jgi:membrane protease YdiL (CAAX protease family)